MTNPQTAGQMKSSEQKAALDALRGILADLDNSGRYQDFAKEYPDVFSRLFDGFVEVVQVDLALRSALDLNDGQTVKSGGQ